MTTPLTKITPTPYGRFSADGSEYIITRPDTPRPWINYLTNGDYVALCSHLGGGFSFYRDHRYHAVLRRAPQQYLEDLPGRLIYIKDEDIGEVWTANVMPLGICDTFEARHGMGYTRFASSYREIASQVRIFVAPGIDAELYHIELRNTGDCPRRLSVYTLAELQPGNLSLDELEPVFMALFNAAEIDERTILLRKDWWHTHYGWSEDNGEWPFRVFQTSTMPPVSLSVDREAFFGPFRGYRNPLAVEMDEMPRGDLSGKPSIAAGQWRVTLAPGESWQFHMALGVQPNADTAENRVQVAALQQPETYAEAWERTRAHWTNLFDAVAVETPDPAINVMVNTWNKYQAVINSTCGRGPSYYHKMQYHGMRDACQDTFGIIPLDPAQARVNILRIAGFFFSDGRCGGGCNKIGIPEPAADKSDLPLWLTLTVADYLRETGDVALLDEMVPLMDGGASTVYDKMLAGVERILEQRGPHGLPLIGHGDWNDAANQIGHHGVGESVWLGQFLAYVIGELLPIMERRGDGERAAHYRQRAEELYRIINEECWDGDWFVRAFKDDGSPVGVQGQDEGAIWINSQTWAAIGGLSTPERLESCMSAVERLMGTDDGMMNVAPAFTRIDEGIGIITRFNPGWKENAAVFSHASAFTVVAWAKLGKGARAVDLVRRLLSLTRDPDRYLMEPYVFSQFAVGPASPEECGRGCYHWLTGTAAWMLRAMADYIIGVHPEFDGLRIQPSVDPSWTTFSMRRRFRNATYDIRFKNPHGVEHGVASITLDGQLVEGTLLPLPMSEWHEVVVVMGSQSV